MNMLSRRASLAVIDYKIHPDEVNPVASIGVKTRTD
jgi:hypothetical protein